MTDNSQDTFKKKKKKSHNSILKSKHKIDKRNTSRVNMCPCVIWGRFLEAALWQHTTGETDIGSSEHSLSAAMLVPSSLPVQEERGSPLTPCPSSQAPVGQQESWAGSLCFGGCCLWNVPRSQALVGLWVLVTLHTLFKCSLYFSCANCYCLKLSEGRVQTQAPCRDGRWPPRPSSLLGGGGRGARYRNS